MSDRRVVLAQELHDGIAQDLVGLGFSIDSLISTSHDQTAKESLRQLRFLVTELIDKVRLEIHQLRTANDLISKTDETDSSYELLRVLAEILRNVTEHAHASHLSIQITDKAFVERSLRSANVNKAVQFIRKGYYCLDPDASPEKLVFNRTVTLKDTWAKEQNK